mmetsp:Transcript_24501/g.38556  ORF Transcript_24501/g.38556 Transcript_24501/m.38556 type:complete len:92 (+) Transcript_24501:1295-1570(+)
MLGSVSMDYAFQQQNLSIHRTLALSEELQACINRRLKRFHLRSGGRNGFEELERAEFLYMQIAYLMPARLHFGFTGTPSQNHVPPEPTHKL